MKSHSNEIWFEWNLIRMKSDSNEISFQCIWFEWNLSSMKSGSSETGFQWNQILMKINSMLLIQAKFDSNAGGRMDFCERKFEAQICKARFCKIYSADLVGCNWIIQVNLWFPKNGNQRSLYLYTMSGGFFPMDCQKPVRLAPPETRPTLFVKIPGVSFGLNKTQTILES